MASNTSPPRVCSNPWWLHLQCGRPGFNPWVGKIPWRRDWLPSPVFWPVEFHGLYSPWGHKELDTTEELSLFTCSPYIRIPEALFMALDQWSINPLLSVLSLLRYS